MKHIKYLFLALLFMPVFTACSDDENSSDGSPVITVGNVSEAMFGDSITINVNCKDDGGIALSTLKAALYYGDENIENVTIRTKDNGDYQLNLFIPFYKNVPDGTAQLKLTLQNIHFTKSEKTIDIPLTRPQYEYINLITSDGVTHKMTPDANNPYLFSTTVNSTTKTIQGYIDAPATGDNGTEITFGQGTQEVTQGVKDNISFVAQRAGNINVTFNTLTYEYSPKLDENASSIEILLSATQTNYTGELIQGKKYEFSGSDDINGSDWYYDPDFFTKNEDGTFTFNAITGTYSITADFQNKAFYIWAMNGTAPATLASDGSGAVWAIGSDGLHKPLYSLINGQSWWTGTDHDLCLAQVKEKVYQLTVEVGKQLNAAAVNFKFFGQPNWGIEFKGSGADYCVSTTSTIFSVGATDGNITLASGATLTTGDVYVFTLDLTNGVKNGVLTVTKK